MQKFPKSHTQQSLGGPYCCRAIPLRWTVKVHRKKQSQKYIAVVRITEDSSSDLDHHQTADCAKYPLTSAFPAMALEETKVVPWRRRIINCAESN